MINFNAESALNKAKAIAYPRFAGTSGEAQAAKNIKQQLGLLGYNVVEEEFYINHTPWGFSRFCLLLALVFLSFSWLLYERIPVVAFCLLLGLLFLQGLSTSVWLMLAGRQTFRPTPNQLMSKNIIAESPSTEDKAKLTVYLIAHYDSKSQSISLLTRIIVLLSAMGAILILLLELVFRLMRSSLGISPQWLFLIASLAGLRLLLVFTHNKSNGGLDNAGSLGVLLEIARVFSQNPIHEVNVKYLFSGAEEWGLLGASQFAGRHAAGWDPKKTWFVNLDGVGIGDRLVVLGKGSSKIIGTLAPVARRLKIRLGKQRLLPGLLVDHIAFARLGFSSVTLACTSFRSLSIHTPGDEISLLDKTGLKEIGGLIEGWLQSLVQTDKA